MIRVVSMCLMSLFCGSMPLARWPNEGFVRTTSAENDITFGYDDPRPERWVTAPDACAAGYWRYGWANRIEKIASIDTMNKKITLARSPSYGIQANRPYYVLNLVEAIDRPGEWYRDRGRAILYFWPPSDLNTAEILMSTLAQPIISMKDTSYIRLEGLTLEMGADDGVEISSGRDNLVADCTIRNMRKDGIRLSGENNGVTHCEIHGIGETGVVLSGGDRRQLISRGNFVRDCRIHDFGRWERTYAPAVQINGVGCIAANNLLYDGPHSAILFGGYEHLIERNEIHSVCYEVDDAGSIYCGRDWGLRGNVIHGNIGWQDKRWLEKNCLGACGGFDFYTIENNIEDQDPRFVDEQKLNLALRDDSPAYSMPGFQRIPFEQIGPAASLK